MTDHYQAKRATLLLLFAAGLPSFLSGCTKHTESHATALQFEPQPRSLSTLSGIPMTHNPKFFFDGVTSGEVRLLTVVDQGENSRIALLDSSDGGDTFGKPVWVTAPEAKLRTHGENSPQLIGTADFMYVAWNQDGDIRLARSVDWGGSFEKPVRISDKPEKAFSGYVSIGVAPNGDVYPIWLDTRDSSAPGQGRCLFPVRGALQGSRRHLREKCKSRRSRLRMLPSKHLVRAERRGPGILATHLSRQYSRHDRGRQPRQRRNLRPAHAHRRG